MIHRFASLILTMIIMVLSVALLMAAVGLPEAREFFPSATLRDMVGTLVSEPPQVRIAVALGALFVSFFFLFFLLRGLSQEFEEEPLLITTDDLGKVVIERESVSLLAVTACKTLDGLGELTVVVRPGQIKGVSLKCRLTVRPGTDVNTLSRRVRERARDAVESLVGLSVEEVNVRAVVALPTTQRRLVQ